MSAKDKNTNATANMETVAESESERLADIVAEVAEMFTSGDRALALRLLLHSVDEDTRYRAIASREDHADGRRDVYFAGFVGTVIPVHVGSMTKYESTSFPLTTYDANGHPKIQNERSQRDLQDSLDRATTVLLTRIKNAYATILRERERTYSALASGITASAAKAITERSAIVDAENAALRAELDALKNAQAQTA